MTTDQQEHLSELINEVLKPLEFDLELYAKISKPLNEMIITNFEFKQSNT